MGNQIKFTLPEIDREKTKHVVESALEKYRIYLLSFPMEHLPKVTASYSFLPPANSNQFHSSTESAAIEKVDYETEKKEYLKWIMAAVNRLSYWERAIIIKRYMEPEDIFDYELYNDLGMSERKYYRLKVRAFYKLAFALKIEEYEDKAVTSS